METTDSVEITGLSDTPVTVDSDLNVTQSGAAPVQDVAAELAASVAVDQAAAAKDAPKAPAPVEEKPDEEAKAEPADAGDKPAVEAKDDEKAAVEEIAGKIGAPAEKPVDDKAPEVKPDEKPEPKEDAKPEDKPAEDEKPEEEKPDEEAKVEVEPSETDKLVEELGGVEVLKAAQPFVEAVYNPELPVSERLSALEAFVPEAQMKEMRNEVFWQAAENPEIHELLAADPEAREVFAQKVFGVPFGYLEKVLNDEKTFLSEDEFKEAVAKFKTEQAAKVEEPKDEVELKREAATKTPAKPKTAAPPKEEAKPDSEVLTPAFTSILDNLSTDVEEIYATAKLEPAATDDADTKRLKAEAATQFEKDWATAFQADEAAMKAYRAVKGLSDQGAEKQAREKYTVLSKNAKRVAAQLLEKVTEPLTTHRRGVQEKGKAAAAARTESAAAAKEKTFDAPAKHTVDISALTSDADITRAMEESIERNSKKG